jgi:enoyl-CoA hydratase/carnithine racemase
MTGVPTPPEVGIARDGAIRTITLCRPEKRNALTLEMFATLTEAFTREPDPEERVTVLRAEGPVFCAGVDLGQRAEGEVREGESPLEILCAALRSYPLPVVAVLTGAAIGGGFMLLTHCDFVVAVEDAKVGNSAVQMGLVPAWLVSRNVRAALGPGLARRLLLVGDLVPASQLDPSLVVAATAEDLEHEVQALLARLAGNAPLSLRAIKATLDAERYEHASHAEVDALIRAAQASEDGKEGVAARRERRPARFRGV